MCAYSRPDLPYGNGALEPHIEARPATVASYRPIDSAREATGTRFSLTDERACGTVLV